MKYLTIIILLIILFLSSVSFANESCGDGMRYNVLIKSCVADEEKK